jgi:PKD repeat protein
LHDADPTATSRNYAISINWGDGSGAQPGTATPAGSPNDFSIRGSHAYREPGNYLASMTVTDDGGAQATTEATIAVADAPLSVTGTAGLTATADSSTGTLPVATFTDTNSLASLSDFSATIDWGDGASISAGPVKALPQGGFSVTGAHTYSTAGSFKATVRIYDKGGSRATTTTNILVAPASGAICATAPAGLRGQEGATSPPRVLAQFTDANQTLASGDFAATVDWGDGSQQATATVSRSSGASLACPGSAFTVSDGHTYAQAGFYTLTVTIKDRGGASAVVTAPVTVTDQPLHGVGEGALSFKRGQAADSIEVARFADGNPTGRGSDYRASISWGDGTSPTAGTIVRANGGFAVMGQHTYNSVGPQTITVTIVDRGGETASVQSHAQVRAVPIAGTLHYSFNYSLAAPYYTLLTSLTIRKAPTGAVALTECHGTGCPFRRRAVRVGARGAVLGGQFRGKHLASRTRITIALVEAGWCGQYWAFRMRSGKPPSVSGPIDLAPEATTPKRRC